MLGIQTGTWWIGPDSFHLSRPGTLSCRLPPFPHHFSCDSTLPTFGPRPWDVTGGEASLAFYPHLSHLFQQTKLQWLAPKEIESTGTDLRLNFIAVFGWIEANQMLQNIHFYYHLGNHQNNNTKMNNFSKRISSLQVSMASSWRSNSSSSICFSLEGSSFPSLQYQTCLWKLIYYVFY